MLAVKIRIRALAACLLLLLAVPSPCVAREPLSEFLPVGAQARLGRGSTETVQYSPDGTLLAVGGSVGIWLYNAQTHEAMSLLTGAGGISSLAFSPNGRILASDGPGHTVILREVSTGTLQHTLQGHTNWVYSVAFSPDGQTLASGGSDDNTVRLWNTATGTLLHTLRGHGSRVEAWRSAPTAKPWPAAAVTTLSACGTRPQAPSCTPWKAMGPGLKAWHSAPTAKPWPVAVGTIPSACGTRPQAPSCTSWKAMGPG